MRRRCAAARVGRYLAGAVVSRTGDEAAGPALLLAGLAVTGSSAAASSVLAGLTVSAVFGGPVFGALLDRSTRPGRVLSAALALYGCGLAATLAALSAGLPVVVTVAVAVVAGLFGPALSAGWSSRLPTVARGSVLRRAHAWDAMTFDAAALVGPALAAACAALLGAPAAVMVSVALVGAALPVAWRMPRGREVRAPAAGVRETVLAGPVAGARAILRSRSLTRATLTSVVSCVAQGMLVACSPLLGVRAFGEADHGVLLLSVVAGSSLAANAVPARCRPRPAPDAVVRRSVLVQGVGLLLAATGHPVLVVAAALVIGAAEGRRLTALFAVRLREAPEDVRARVFTLGASLKTTAFALGAALAGPLAAWSLPGALLAAAGCALLAAPRSFRCSMPAQGTG